MHRRVRRTSLVAALAGLLGLLAACGSGDGTPTLTWYTNPDAGGQERMAAACTEAAGGRYRVVTSPLPRDAASQREQLARRLAAHDSSIDIISLDPPFLPEMAQAGFLAPVPQDKVEAFSDDVLEGALAGATWDGTLVAVPFWANTQLLWYRTSVAEEAGLDLEEDDVTWEELIEVARSDGRLLAVQGAKAESLTVWVNALVASAGGQILEDPTATADELTLSLDSDAGRAAAEIIGTIGREGLGGPGLPTADENASLSLFQGDSGAFMVNWPFVWSATAGAVEDGAVTQDVLDDVGWAMYPRVDDEHDAAPPLGGINLAVGAFGEHPDLAYEAVECIVAVENQSAYFVSDGNPPARGAAYDAPEVAEAFPMADLIRDSIEQAVPRPQTPYYNEVSIGLQETWHPASSVSETTPASSTDRIVSVLRGESLL